MRSAGEAWCELGAHLLGGEPSGGDGVCTVPFLLNAAFDHEIEKLEKETFFSSLGSHYLERTPLAF